MLAIALVLGILLGVYVATVTEKVLEEVFNTSLNLGIKAFIFVVSGLSGLTTAFGSMYVILKLYINGF